VLIGQTRVIDDNLVNGLVVDNRVLVDCLLFLLLCIIYEYPHWYHEDLQKPS
jgi:hypothetical protein